MRTFEEELHNHIAHSVPHIFSTIADTGKLDDDTISSLERVVDEVKKQFSLIGKPGESRAAGAPTAEGDAAGDDETDEAAEAESPSESTAASESTAG